jgi:hypothetical protein
MLLHPNQQGLASQLPARLEEALRREVAGLSVGLADAVAPAMRAAIAQTAPPQVAMPVLALTEAILQALVYVF